MKTYALRTPHSGFRTSKAFTLIELLVVISIIAILAALLMPALAAVKIKAQIRKAQLEANGIVAAINHYEADTSKFPVSTAAQNAATAVPSASGGPEDFTYGTVGVFCAGPGGTNALGAGFSTPANPQGSVSAPTPNTSSLGYQANNSEVMAVLLDQADPWPATPGVPTINKDHVKNPQRTGYLHANRVGDNKGGVGQDGIYRDPWGNPYIITIDLNFDEKARDVFYRRQQVSQSSGTAGFNGLMNMHTPPTPPNGNSDFFECNAPVMVWSPGPDKLVDPSTVANKGVNKDNIVSWRQ